MATKKTKKKSVKKKPVPRKKTSWPIPESEATELAARKFRDALVQRQRLEANIRSLQAEFDGLGVMATARLVDLRELSGVPDDVGLVNINMDKMVCILAEEE